jgi:hypothetical protein
MTTLALPFPARRGHARATVLALCATTLTLIAIAAAEAADAASAWQGSYRSVALDRQVTVQLTLPAGANPGELKFVSLACAVKLAQENSGAMTYTIAPGPDESGPYCGSWLGGRVELHPGGDAQHRRAKITSASGKSKIELSLVQAGP